MSLCNSYCHYVAYTFVVLPLQSLCDLYCWCVLYTVVLWPILFFRGLYSRRVTYTIVVWHILSLCVLYSHYVGYNKYNNAGYLYSNLTCKYHAKRAFLLITQAGLCHSTFIPFENLHSGAYSHISFGLYTLLWQILLFVACTVVMCRCVAYTVVVWSILSLCGLYK